MFDIIHQVFFNFTFTYLKKFNRSLNLVVMSLVEGGHIMFTKLKRSGDPLEVQHHAVLVLKLESISRRDEYKMFMPAELH